jgi:hypothetical protein
MSTQDNIVCRLCQPTGHARAKVSALVFLRFHTKSCPWNVSLVLEVFVMRAAGSGFVLDKEANGSGLDTETFFK